MRRFKTPCIVNCLALTAGLLPGALAAEPAPPPSADFVRDVQPLFLNTCAECHGTKKQKGGLRLDNRADAMAGGNNGPVIVPGKADESRLYKAVAGLDKDLVMPPKGKGKRVTARETGLIKMWIDGGAVWPDNVAAAPAPAGAEKSEHWSFNPPVRPEAPRVGAVSTPRPSGSPDAAGSGRDAPPTAHPIDAFILARLAKEGLAPSPEADRRTLIRRLSLDLLGLPPTPAEVEAFVGDAQPDAWERLVDRLLASPHFGERWARHWMDLARYADSDGYEKDLPRPHAWRWREWVIDAINRDMPFDAFTVEQIAGDLLSNATVDQQAATGFHRNTQTNREGGVDIEEYRCKNVVDRTSTVGSVWLGLTVGCAECHDHKYDPLTQREFYQLYAFFDNTDEVDVHAPLAKDLAPAREKQAALQAVLAKYGAAADPAQIEWEKKVTALPAIWETPDRFELPTFGAPSGANLELREDTSFLVTGTIGDKDVYLISVHTPTKRIAGIRLEALADDQLPRGGPGWAPNGNFVLSEMAVEASPSADKQKLQPVPLASASADYSQEGFPVAKAIDGDDKTGWAVDLPQLPMCALDRCAVFEPKAPFGFEGGTLVKVTLRQQQGGRNVIGRLRVSITTADPAQLAGQTVPQRIRDLVAIPAEKRTAEQKAMLRRYHQATFAPKDVALAEVAKATAELDAAWGPTRAQTLYERAIRRHTHVHIRGDFLRPGVEVRPGTPGFLPPLRAEHDPPNRLDLARWIVDPANPLTARVAANHIWKHLFGKGIVVTAEDFGTQGDKPTHPELLDWLATELVRMGWSRKALIKTIVMSAAYRRLSADRPELQEKDARNLLLARQNRLRLEAEALRDQALAAAGILNGTVGGPSFRPPLPFDLGTLTFSFSWPTSAGAELRRRGMYIFLQRNVLFPMLTTLDAPDTQCPVARRERANTPLISLTMLNDSLFVECAQALGRRMAAEAGDDPAARIRYGFARCVARPPDAQELEELLGLYRDVRAAYAKDAASANRLVGPDKPDRAAPADAAACVAVARAMLNLDEFVTRE